MAFSQLQVGLEVVVAPRLADRRQPLAEVLPCQVGGAAGGAAGSSCGAQWQLQLLDLANTIDDSEEVPGEAPVIGGAQSRRAVLMMRETVADHVGNYSVTGGGDGGVCMEAKIGRRGLHPRLQEGRLLLVQEEVGVRVLCRRRRVGEWEEQRVEVVGDHQEIIAAAIGDGATVVCSCKKPCALLG